MANDTLKAEIKASNDNERQVNEMFDAAALKALETQNALDFAAKESAAAEQLILDEKETIGNKRFGLANSGRISKDDADIFKAARQQRTYEDSVQELAASDRDGLGKLKEVDTSKGIHHDTGKPEVIKQQVEDEFKLVTQGLNDIKAEAALKRIAAEKLKAQELAEKIAKRDLLWADINKNNEKLLASQEFMDNLPGKEDIVTSTYTPGVTNQSQFEKTNQRAVEVSKQAEQDAQNNTTAKDMTTTVRELAAERKTKAIIAQSAADNEPYVTSPSERGLTPAEARKKQMSKLAAQEAQFKASNAITSKMDRDNIKGKYNTMLDKDGEPTLTGKDPFRFTTLEYPKNITSDPQYGHYILFYVNVQNKTKYSYHGYNDDGNHAVIGDTYTYNTYTSNRVGADSGQILGSQTTTDAPTDRAYTTNVITRKVASEAGLVDDLEYLRGGLKAGKPGSELHSNQVTLMRQRKATQGLNSKLNLTSRITDSVAMYLPANVENSTTTQYSGDELGMAGYLALGGADLLGQLQNRDFAAMGDTAVDMGERILTDMAKKTAIGAIDLFTGASTEDSINKVFGQTLNPFIEVTFKSIGVRTFDYTFNFSPKSQEETAEVKAIIQLFRFHMVPELKGSNHRYMTLPSTFDIHYMYQTSAETSYENDYYNKIATCVLKDCRVNYTEGGVKSFDDGAPTQISMTLSFMETEMLTKKKVNDGF